MPSPYNFKNIPIETVKISKDHRPINKETLIELYTSIDQFGLLQPIIVNEDHLLIAGRHRLEVCKKLVWKEIPATIIPFDECDAAQVEDDENRVRSNPTCLDYLVLLKKRKNAYEERFPETKNGGYRRYKVLAKSPVSDGHGDHLMQPDSQSSVSDGQDDHLIVTTVERYVEGKNKNDTPSFVDFEAIRRNISARTIRRELGVSYNLAPDVIEKLRDTPIANKRFEIIRLAKLMRDKQREVVDQYLSATKDPLPNMARFLPKTKRWRHPCVVAKEKSPEFLNENPLDAVDDFDDEVIQLVLSPVPHVDELPPGKWIPSVLPKVRKSGYLYLIMQPEVAQMHAYLDYFESEPEFFVSNMLVWPKRKPTEKKTVVDYQFDWWSVLVVRSEEARDMDRPTAKDYSSVLDYTPDKFAHHILRHASHVDENVFIPFAEDWRFLAEQAGKDGRNVIACLC